MFKIVKISLITIILVSLGVTSAEAQPNSFHSAFSNIQKAINDGYTDKIVSFFPRISGMSVEFKSLNEAPISVTKPEFESELISFFDQYPPDKFEIIRSLTRGPLPMALGRYEDKNDNEFYIQMAVVRDKDHYYFRAFYLLKDAPRGVSN